MRERDAARRTPPATGHGSPATLLSLREANGRDAARIAAIYAPYVRDTAISFEVEPPSAAEMRRRIENLTATYPWLVCADAAQVVGYAYASTHRERAAYQWSVDVSVYIAAAAQRRGIGRALYTALLALVTAQGFHNAYGGITLPNASSVALHETMGFVPVGVYRRVGFKHGAWHDVGWWVRELAPHPASPAPPRPIGALRGTPAWSAALDAGHRRLRA